MTEYQMSQVFGFSESTIKSIVKVFKAEGRVQPKARGGAKNVKATADDRAYVAAMVDANCQIKLRDIKTRLLDDRSVELSEGRISQMLGDLEYTVKRASIVPEARNNPSTLERRTE
jgi:transposase